MSIEQNTKERFPQGQETTDLQPNSEIPEQFESKSGGETITAIEGALESFKSETELTPEQDKEATAPEKEELKEIDQTAENAKTEAVSETRQPSAESEINAPELPKECEAFFNELSLGDLKDIDALKNKFEAIFTDGAMKEIKIDSSFKKETADRYFGALMEQAQWTLESKIAEIENSKKYASAKQEITKAFHSIVEGGKFALAHKAVAVAFKVGTSASALAKMGAGGVTFAFVAGLNHLTGRGYEMVAGKKIPRLAKKLEEELEKQERLEREQQDIMGGMKDNLALLMNCDKNRQEQLEIYQAELKNIGEQNLAEIFSGETDSARAKQQQLLKLIQSTQDIKNLTGKEQKTALKERRELIKTAIGSNALDEFITYQMAEEIKRIKIDLVKDNEPVVLTPQMENQIIMQASRTVRRDIDTILADAIAGEKHDEIEEAGKSYVGSFMDKIFGNSDFARKVAEGFKDGVIFSAASDMAGQAYIAFNMGKQALESGIRQRTQEYEVIESSGELYNEVFLAAKSDEEIKKMIDKTDDQLKAIKKEDDATEKTKALSARKKQLEQVLALNSDDIQEIIKTARAQNKTGQRTAVERAKIDSEIKKLENKYIFKQQLNELKDENNQTIGDLSKLAEDIVLGKGQEIQLAADLANKQKKATSLVGLIGRFHKLTNEEQKQVLLKAGWEAGKAGLFATIGAKMVDMGAQAYKGEGIKLGEHAMGIIDGATFGLGGKMLANLTSKGVAEAAETKKNLTYEEIKERAKDLQHPASTPTIETIQPSTQNEITKKAQEGDSIWKIADKIRTDMETSGKIKRQNYSEKGAEALKWNEAETTRITNEIKNELSENLKNPDFIKPGQEFKTNENAILQRLQKRGIINEQGQPKGLTESKVKNITENNAKIAELVKQVKAENKKISDPSKRVKITTGKMIEEAIKGKPASEIIKQSPKSKVQSQKLETTKTAETKVAEVDGAVNAAKRSRIGRYNKKATERTVEKSRETEFKPTIEQSFDYSIGKYRVPENLNEGEEANRLEQVDIFIEDGVYKIKTASTLEKRGGLILSEIVPQRGSSNFEILALKGAVIRKAENIDRKLNVMENSFNDSKACPKNLTKEQFVEILARHPEEFQERWEEQEIKGEIKYWDEIIKKGGNDLLIKPEQMEIAESLRKDKIETDKLVNALKFTNPIESQAKDFANVASRENPRSREKNIIKSLFGLSDDQVARVKIKCNGNKLTIKNVLYGESKTPVEIVLEHDNPARIGSTYYSFGGIRYTKAKGVTPEALSEVKQIFCIRK